MLFPVLSRAYRKLELSLYSFRKSRKNHRKQSSSIAFRCSSVALTVCLLITSTPAATQTIVALANESALSFHFWFNNSGLRKLIQGGPVSAAKKQEKQSDRDAKISQIQIFPGNLTVDLNDRVKFNAIALDTNANTIGGVKVNWNARGASVHEF